MKEIKYEVDGELLITPCPHKKKHGVGFDIIMVGSDQCWACSHFKGVMNSVDVNKVHCDCEQEKANEHLTLYEYCKIESGLTGLALDKYINRNYGRG